LSTRYASPAMQTLWGEPRRVALWRCLFASRKYLKFAQHDAHNLEYEEVEQENESEIKQESEIKCDADVDDNDVIGVTGSNVAANDCDSTQTAAAVQSNTNTDNDVQVASADACQQIAALVGFNVC
jgi:hypothetical protein